MDRKDVIDWLYRMLSSVRTEMFNVPRLWKGSLIEALQYAIQSLETDEAYNLLYEETTKKDLEDASYCKLVDCIDREYTAKYVEEFANNEYVSKEEAETFYLIADGIRHIPSVYPNNTDLIKANTQLKKQLEMLKLDRECDKPKGKWIVVKRDYETYLECSVCGYESMDHCPICGSRNVFEPQESEVEK